MVKGRDRVGKAEKKKSQLSIKEKRQKKKEKKLERAS